MGFTVQRLTRQLMYTFMRSMFIRYGSLSGVSRDLYWHAKERDEITGWRGRRLKT